MIGPQMILMDRWILGWMNERMFSFIHVIPRQQLNGLPAAAEMGLWCSTPWWPVEGSGGHLSCKQP